MTVVISQFTRAPHTFAVGTRTQITATSYAARRMYARMLSALVCVTLTVIWQRTTKWWERKWRRLESGYKAPSKHHKDSIRRPALDRHRSQESGSCSNLGDSKAQPRNSRDRLVDISSTSRRFVRSNVRRGRARSREIVPRKRRRVLILRSRCPFVRAKIALWTRATCVR